MGKNYCIFLLYTIIFNISLTFSAATPGFIDWVFYGERESSDSYRPQADQQPPPSHQSYQAPYQEQYETLHQIQRPISPQTPYRPTCQMPQQMHHYPQNEQSKVTNRNCDCTCGVLHRKKSRIFNGIPSSHLKYPWLAKITKYHQTQTDKKFKVCMGVLITMLHVLSAAHCFESGYVYSYAYLSDGYNYDIDRVFIHEDYDSNTRPLINDIAVALLKERTNLGNPIGPICLPKEGEDFARSIGTAAGWGWTSEKRSPSSNLREAKLPILTKEECHRSSYEYTMPKNTFCAGSIDGGADTCNGDSGGPIMVRGRKEEMIAAGVVSYGRGCGKPGFPGVNTNITGFLNWIMKKIGTECICRRP